MTAYLLSVLAAAASVALAPPGIKHFRVANWSVSVEADRFNGEHTCRISRDGAVYGPDVSTFQFPRKADTALADYRIDGGPAKQAVEPVEDVETLNLSALEHPSEGRVRIPTGELINADQIAIRLKGERRMKVFRLDGLADAVAFAHDQGCRDRPSSAGY